MGQPDVAVIVCVGLKVQDSGRAGACVLQGATPTGFPDTRVLWLCQCSVVSTCLSWLDCGDYLEIRATTYVIVRDFIFASRTPIDGSLVQVDVKSCMLSVLKWTLLYHITTWALLSADLVLTYIHAPIFGMSLAKDLLLP